MKVITEHKTVAGIKRREHCCGNMHRQGHMLTIRLDPPGFRVLFSSVGITHCPWCGTPITFEEER